MKKLLPVFYAIIIVSLLNAQEKPVYKDASAPVEKRVADLIGRMTLDEKIELLGGTGIATKVNERLGIPEFRMTDGPAGVRLDTNKATAFPSPVGMAATWNTDLLFRAGVAIAKETKGYGRHAILGPCINITRTTLWGRNFESYGEDPFLTSRLGVNYIEGVQKEGVAAVVKHFAVNNQEVERMYVNEIVSRRALNEIYFPAFKAAVQEAGSMCVMNSYNKINGQFACENDYTLRDILRNEWKFDGLIMSDWWAVHSVIPAALGEMDLEMPAGDYLNIKNLKEPIEKGIVPVSAIDKKVKHILALMFKLGLFDREPDKIDKTMIHSELSKKTAYDIALSSMVLLKNDKNILPLAKDKIKTIAVIGQNSINTKAGGGGSAEVPSIATVSILDGLKNRLGSNVKINYSKGAELDNEESSIESITSKYLFTDVTGKTPGLKAEFYDNTELTGKPVFVKVDQSVDFNWDTTGPGNGVASNNYSVRWSGYLKVDKTDRYVLSTLSDDGSRLYFNDSLLQNQWFPHRTMFKNSYVYLQKGKYYKIQFELFEKGGGAVAKLAWNNQREALREKAVETAKNADYVIVTVGTMPAFETESRDRPDLFLPNEQDSLIQVLAEANKNVIVLINAGSPVSMEKWINKVKAVVDVWFPGSEGGNAVADVLLGNYNPSGKLPITFPHRWEDCSAYPTYGKLDERVYMADDIYVGYRHFDKYKIEPLFPFGFGLSYTTFDYSGIKITPDGEGYNVSFSIKNTGKVKGEETAQLYVASSDRSIDRAVQELKGFSKTLLEPGETKNVNIKINKDAFAYYSEQYSTWKINAGTYKICIGSSSRDIKLTSDIEIK
jgi:beta-glucosidase